MSRSTITDPSDPSGYLASLSAMAPAALPAPLHAYHGQAQAEINVPHQHQGQELEIGGGEDAYAAVPAVPPAPEPPKKPPSTRKVPLTVHEALTYAPRGIYFDFTTNQVRCSCNRKSCDGWASYSFTRHFGLECHTKYEEERLTDMEKARLREARLMYIRKNPVVLEESVPPHIPGTRRRRKKKGDKKEKEKPLTVCEKRVQERHWMEMWRDAKNELRQLRQDLKEEEDPEVRAELVADIDGLRKRKRDWGSLLGLETPTFPITR